MPKASLWGLREKGAKNPNSLGWASFVSEPHPAAILHSDSGFFGVWVNRLEYVYFYPEPRTPNHEPRTLNPEP